MNLIRKLLEMRTKKRRWIYVMSAMIALFFAVLAAHEDLIGTLPYLLIIAISIAQFMRPTLLTWAVLTVTFLVYTVLVIPTATSQPLQEFLVFFLAGLLMVITLVWARPTREPAAQPH